MPRLDPSIVKYFLPLDTERFSPKQQHLRQQQVGLLLLIKEEIFKQINIRMTEDDKTKTTFVTMWGTFYYYVMPFGLKNVGATYQMAMVTLFHDMMHKDIELSIGTTSVRKSSSPSRPIWFSRSSSHSLPDSMLTILGMHAGQEDDFTHAERAIYYLNKKFTDGESNYPEIKKMCFTLVWVMQRLRQYTSYHTIRLLSKANPMSFLLDSPSSMKNIAK
ncbi:hypothetical protein CRG98_031230 [Punica granatum]|uniref:Reverse transcriptase RNase H-like domain-containing protein n=1 Tax=Punica granatum TaxID=22663 RepID=A0A2I0IWJ8_PUNGR|nr:hypothetical protein CRG98_031230 [Punica granatum]